MRKRENGPDWDQLFEFASAQDGYFSVKQARSAGISPPNLQAHLKSGSVQRVHRKVYRLTRYPAGDHEDLAAIWLYFDQQAVFSHETALSLHSLSDVLPAQISLTLPERWRRRKPLPGVVVHVAEVPASDRTWYGAVPITTVRRTLSDCAAADLSPEFLQQAASEALERGLVRRNEISDVERTLASYGGIGS
jgi:predicted transcriptional regulator of viral defense system